MKIRNAIIWQVFSENLPCIRHWIRILAYKDKHNRACGLDRRMQYHKEGGFGTYRFQKMHDIFQFILLQFKPRKENRQVNILDQRSANYSLWAKFVVFRLLKGF